METDSILGKMEESTVDNMSTIKSMDLASILGLMEGNTLANGLIVKGMVRAK